MQDRTKSLLALAAGTFGLGITEFALMGILPIVADNFGISIPQAGHFISAYALGVCVGAPLIVMCFRRWPLKRMLILLMGLFSFASVAMAICPANSGFGYWMMLALRFIAGLPHGAYFGVSSIVADKVSKGVSSAMAVAIMSAGMTVANLIGNPFVTFMTAALSWRYVFVFSALTGCITLYAITRFVPYVDALPDNGFKGEFRFLNTLAPWLLIFATLLGNGGVFCWYSYISPLLTEVSGVKASMMTVMMVLAGAGMVVGNLIGGRISDRMGPAHTGRAMQFGMVSGLLLIFFFAQYAWAAIPLMVFLCACLFGVSAPQQLLILRWSKGGELMGGAMVQIAFNLGNAIGSWCGGLPIEAGLGYRYPALIGCCFVAGGIACYTIFCRLYEKKAIFEN